MKVTDIKVYAVEAVRRNWTFIEVETDVGITGLGEITLEMFDTCLLYTSPSPRDGLLSRMPSSA